MIALLPALGVAVSVGISDITPPENLPLGGYTARAGKIMDGVGDRLYARAVIFDQVTVVACDMLTIPESLREAVWAKIGHDRPLFLAATHTHCAPDSQMLNSRMTFGIPGIASFKQKWLDWYADRIAQAVLKAKRISAGDFRLARTYADLNKGRRPGADPDKFLSELRFGNTPLLSCFAAHGTFYGSKENLTRGDWPGSLAASRHEAVLPGAIGDVAPFAPGGNPTERIANFVCLASKKLKKAKNHPMQAKVSSVTVQIPLLPVLASLAFSSENHIPRSLAQTIVAKFAPTQESVIAFRVGKLAVVGIPGEPTSHLGRRIRDYGWGLGFTDVWVVSHVNGWMGYILDPADYARGGYEASLSFYGTAEGDAVVQTAKKALLKLASQEL